MKQIFQICSETSKKLNVDELSDEEITAIKEKFGFKDDKEVDSIVKSKKSVGRKSSKKKNEAARLAKLSEEERQKELLNKEKSDFEKEKAFRQEQLFVEKGNQLQSIGISKELASRIKGDTAEEILEDVKTFKRLGTKR